METIEVSRPYLLTDAQAKDNLRLLNFAVRMGGDDALNIAEIALPLAHIFNAPPPPGEST